MKKNRLASLIALCLIALLMQSCESYLDKAIYEVIKDGQIDSNESVSLKIDFQNESPAFTEDEIIARIMKVADKKSISIDSSDIRCSLFPEPIPPKPIQVSVYLDNTLSMEGYALAKNAESFTSVFAGINHYYSAKPDVAKCGYYVRKNGIERIEYSDLLSQLTNKTVPFTDSYQLDGFMEIVCGQIVAIDSFDKICFFVTDGIPSGTNEEIKKNERFNLDNRAILKTRIANQIRSLSDGNYSAAIYCFDANFNGIYYNYKNGHVPSIHRKAGLQPWTNDIVRPFYVIALGNRQLVGEFHKSVISGLQDFSPISRVLFAKGNDLCKPCFSNSLDYEYIDKNGVSKDTIFVANSQKKDNMNVEFYYKKESFPSCVQDDLDSVVFIGFGNDTIKCKVDGDKVRFTLPISSLEGGKNLTIKVKDELPGWVRDRNTKTDETFTINTPDTLTLNLAVLVQAIHDGIFNTEGRVYYDEKKFIVSVVNEE